MSDSSPTNELRNPPDVGAAWANRLRDRGYAPAGDAAFLVRFRRSPYIRLIHRYAAPAANSLILEPGCGSGKFSLALASLGHHVVVLDYVRRVLAGVRAAEGQLAASTPLLGACQGRLERLPFALGAFDLVMNEGVVEHYLDPSARLAVLSEMARVTRPDGAVAVLVPNGAHPLIRIWEARLQAFRTSPPMTHYTATGLAEDLAQIGLDEIRTDGIYPWRSWVRLWPWNKLYGLAAALDHVAFLPRGLRERWAINLIGIGRVPSRAAG